MDAIPPSQIERAVDLVKRKGVKALKVEFEALVEPVGCPEVEGLPCPARGCRSGLVPVACSGCHGTGQTPRDGPCEDCDGTGQSGDEEPCFTCSGHGRLPPPVEERSAEYFDRFARQFRRAVVQCLSRGEKYRDLVLFARPYADLSVGTELTLTIPIERVQVLPQLVVAFCATFARFGNDPSRSDRAVEGAGMHMAFLWSRTYPTTRKLPREALDSFRASAGKLMLAMSYLGSARGRTRSLDYRLTNLTTEDGWIDLHDDTCMEFRVFEPCYDEPARIVENFLCMVRLLHFFTPTPGNRHRKGFRCRLPWIRKVPASERCAIHDLERRLHKVQQIRLDVLAYRR